MVAIDPSITTVVVVVEQSTQRVAWMITIMIYRDNITKEEEVDIGCVLLRLVTRLFICISQDLWSQSIYRLDNPCRRHKSYPFSLYIRREEKIYIAVWGVSYDGW